MAHIQYLNFDGEDLPLPVSYDVGLSDVEADSSGETEAGTRQRDLVRSGVVEISCSFNVSHTFIKAFHVFGTSVIPAFSNISLL